VERHFGDVHRAPGGGALEDDFFHLRAAKRPRTLLSEHPSDGVGDIRLAAAVRTDDRGYAGLEQQFGFIGE
jgi:hypothetical protein